MAKTLNFTRLSALTLSMDDLICFNYPRFHPSIKGRVQVVTEHSFYSIITEENKRRCDKCKKTYIVNKSGMPVKEEACMYHTYRLGRQLRHQCCQGKPGARPCQKAPFHVTADIDVCNLTGFVSTGDFDHGKGIFALDCEMVYTVAGFELAAVSVVDDECNLVYEKLVKPDNLVLDYNTEHSNLTAQDLKRATTTRKDVQDKLLGLFGKQTILVGHALHEDLMQLRLIHDLIIDTSKLYSYSKTKYFRSSLKSLQEKYFPTMKNEYQLKCRYDAELSMKLALLFCK